MPLIPFVTPGEFSGIRNLPGSSDGFRWHTVIGCIFEVYVIYPSTSIGTGGRN